MAVDTTVYGRVHGYVHGVCTAVYTTMHTAVFTAVYSTVHGRVDSRVREVYTCTRPVYTARRRPCIRPCTHGRVPRYRLHDSYMAVNTSMYGRVHGYVHGRVHRCVYRRVLDRYTVVSAAMYGRCTHANSPCTRPVGGRAYGCVHVRVHGRVRAVYTVAYTIVCTHGLYTAVCV